MFTPIISEDHFTVRQELADEPEEKETLHGELTEERAKNGTLEVELADEREEKETLHRKLTEEREKNGTLEREGSRCARPQRPVRL
jgi:predicted RNase H-like nuclease (RuvC/YqgF family)